MLTPVPPTDCMRAREAVSARLDRELGELDGLRLDQHLEDCAACRAFAAEAAVLALRLRSAELVPAPEGLFSVPSRRRVARPVAAVAATLVLAAAVGSSFFMGELLGGRGGPGPAVPAATAQADPGLVAMLRANARPRAQTGRVIAL